RALDAVPFGNDRRLRHIDNLVFESVFVAAAVVDETQRTAARHVNDAVGRDQRERVRDEEILAARRGAAPQEADSARTIEPARRGQISAADRPAFADDAMPTDHLFHVRKQSQTFGDLLAGSPQPLTLN